MKQPAIYIMSNYKNGTLYVGVTSNLSQRVYQHKEIMEQGFTARFALNKLVYYEIFDDMNAAISREKQLKAGSRAKKITLIEKENLTWQDLYPTII